jgi:hypothetical protein
MMEFTHATYRALLQHIAAQGHTICPLRDVPERGKFVILRHDIDYSVVKALELAEIEHDLGARATVFLMLGSTYYNLLALEHLRAARRIVTLGHEIGLHYDTDAFDHLPPEEQSERVTLQARFLSDVLQTPVTSVAQHNPSVTATRVKVVGFRDAYADEYCRRIAYLSDSRRLFGAADPFKFFEQHDQAQLLIHPLWWSVDNKSRWDAFAAIRHAAVAQIDAQLLAMNRSMERDEMARQSATERSDHG